MKIGYAFCGSFCTLARSLDACRRLIEEGFEVVPICSETVYMTDTRFTPSAAFREKVETLCRRPLIHTVVTMAVKAHLRQDRPTVLALASNDSLSQNLQNIAALLSRKRLYFVPLCQDDPEKEPHSLVADFSRIGESLHAALEDKQLRPLFT